MKRINRLFQGKYWYLVALLALVAIAFISSLFNYRIDLTKEKRFSLSSSTEQLLQNLDTPFTVTVLLDGELPADYKKLRNATADLLNEFRDRSNNFVKVKFEKPGEGLDDSLRYYLYDSLSRMGVVFEQGPQTKEGQDTYIIPSAIVEYPNRRPFVLDLRSSRKVFKQYDVINELPEEDKEASINSAEALLEFKFANAIDKLSRKTVPTIAYVVGNGQPIDRTVNDLGESLRNDYRLAVFDLKQGYPDADIINALVIVKPTQPFTDDDKLKLDQFIMNGGHVLWFVDKLYAELDSLMRSRADFVAFDRNLNLDDLLFKYGVRINGDLVQDLNCAKIPIVIGYQPDGSPRMQRHPWPYYPFLSSRSDNPIAKNLDRVLPIFPSSIDTVQAPGIKKTVLLATDTNSRKLSTPAMVQLETVKSEEDLMMFNRSHVPVAVLLEGQFSSLFANRLTTALQDSLTAATGKPFLPKASREGKQVVVSDADIVTNAITQSQGPLPMGMIPFEDYRFANKEFFLNAVDYLVSNSGIFESRNKDFTLRLLDKGKLETTKQTWQIINIVVPLVIIAIFGVIFLYLRKRAYSH